MAGHPIPERARLCVSGRRRKHSMARRLTGRIQACEVCDAGSSPAEPALQRHSSMAEQPVDNRQIVVRFRVSLPTAPWSNGYDFPLSPGRSGFNSPWGRQLRAYRLTARTSGSQPDGRGSNPRTLAIRGGRRKGVRHRCAEPDPFPARRPGNRTRLSESRNAGLIPAEPTIRQAARKSRRRSWQAHKRDVVQGKDACFGSRRTQVRVLSSRPPGSSNGKTLLLQRRDECSIHSLGSILQGRAHVPARGPPRGAAPTSLSSNARTHPS